ncbi:hypothetical protein ASPTUDRAFT_61564 [Aspergillus tubingensis CBS 134.48]|uniref:Uncharacterized protein n=1 Tax=Aspergillus tubingensis (strain CBS 134.48) TaxID=767770 RepID=A0A1L9NFY2_ASPTC|nr:hypothetical protein ASPTUDRAFT_61564 [Aspergillus tubingensis CBS 134.48]
MAHTVGGYRTKKLLTRSANEESSNRFRRVAIKSRSQPPSDLGKRTPPIRPNFCADRVRPCGDHDLNHGAGGWMFTCILDHLGDGDVCLVEFFCGRMRCPRNGLAHAISYNGVSLSLIMTASVAARLCPSPHVGFIFRKGCNVRAGGASVIASRSIRANPRPAGVDWQMPAPTALGPANEATGRADGATDGLAGVIPYKY